MCINFPGGHRLANLRIRENYRGRMNRLFHGILANIRMVIFVVIAVILLLCWSSLKNDTGRSEIDDQQMSVADLHLCSKVDQKWVNVSEFSNQKDKSICATVISDIEPVYLTLIVQKEDNRFDVEFTDSGEFVNGPLNFSISVDLPSGLYTARIMYARKTLAEIKFRVQSN